MVEDLIYYDKCNFMQKCTHNTAPSSFQDVFIKNRNFDRSLSYNLKLVRKTSLSPLRSFPTLVFPRVWNALTPESILTSFIKNVSYLLRLTVFSLPSF